MVSNGTYGCFRDDSKPDLRQSVAVCCRPASAIRPPSPGPVIRPAMQVRGPSWGCVKMCEDVWRCVKMCEDVWRCVKMCEAEKEDNRHYPIFFFVIAILLTLLTLLRWSEMCFLEQLIWWYLAPFWPRWTESPLSRQRKHRSHCNLSRQSSSQLFG